MMKNLLNSHIVRLFAALVAGAILGVWLKGGATLEHEVVISTDSDSVWTCSMHPQIRQNEPGNCPICGMELIPVPGRAVQGNARDPFVYTMSPEAAAMAKIQTSEVTYLRPTASIFLTGKVAVNEKRLRTITAHYGGRIEKLYVDFTGQQVKTGEKLATIYSPELMTAQQELLETAKNKALNTSLYEAARERLRLWKITKAQIDKVEETGEIVTAFDVYSDASGVVIDRKVTRGDHVVRGSPLFQIADLSEVWIVMDAYESDLPWIGLGSQVTFSVASLPGKRYRSEVTFIDPVVQQQTRTASIRVEVQNADLELKLDMFVNAQISSNATDKALLVPQTAVLWTGKRSVVYADVSVAEMPAYEMREVVLGRRAGDQYEILSGVKEGEQIVTQGAFAVDAAAQLSGNFSMMNRPENGQIQHSTPEKRGNPTQGHSH
jgi:membrane fusion protein, copper/silver efflux system